ncbi:MAG: hypothetical protein OXE78_07685, partial [Gammaproteobacteria bacterium]|nr:hypothetical protein [Gammaproteobacteria bacterium]
MESGIYWWEIGIAAMVVTTSLASATLTMAAVSQWTGGWRVAALLPLLLLLLWVALILLSRWLNPGSHQLWTI